MGLFSRRTPDEAEARIARLETHLNGLQTYLEDVARVAAEAEATAPANDATPAPASLAAPGATDTPDAHLGNKPPRIVNADMVESSLEELRSQLAELTEGLSRLDTRLSAMGAELTNQLTELGSEIDALGGAGLDADALTDLKTAQVRLAQEQARYQIAFRDDLAALAERLRTPGTNS